MLRRGTETVRRRPGPALGALAAGLVLGFVLALVTGGGTPAPVRAGTVPLPAGVAPGDRLPPGATQPGAQDVDDTLREPLGAGLRRAVAGALRTYGGTAEAALWLDGWSAPVVAGDAGREMRMWSMSKAVTAVAVYQALASPPSSDLSSALVDALTRSDNCAQRRVVLGLQTLLHGLDPARAAFERVLNQAGAHAAVPAQAVGPQALCLPYLTAHTAGIGSPSAPTYQYGIATWSVLDAIRFAHALGSGTYGDAGTQVLELLREPKQLGPEANAQTFTTNVAWGAGRAFVPWAPAYKAGWGGSQQGDFFVGQLAVLILPRGQAAVAVMYHPPRQPDIDDPGQEHAADALEAIQRGVADAFSQNGVG